MSSPKKDSKESVVSFQIEAEAIVSETTVVFQEVDKVTESKTGVLSESLFLDFFSVSTLNVDSYL